MRKLAVDFRTPSEPPRWAWLLLGLLGVVAVGVSLIAARGFYEVRTLRAQRDALVYQLSQSARLPPEPAPIKPYEASAREMLALATSEWPKMLAALESVAMVGVTPVEIEVAPVDRVVRVQVEFTDYAGLFEYIAALNAGHDRQPWSLVQSQSPTSLATTSNQKSTATLLATWP